MKSRFIYFIREKFLELTINVLNQKVIPPRVLYLLLIKTGKRGFAQGTVK